MLRVNITDVTETEVSVFSDVFQLYLLVLYGYTQSENGVT